MKMKYKSMGGLTVKDGRLMNDREPGVSGIEQAARIKKSMCKARRVGEIADGDTGDAALAGAVMGGSRERRTKRKSKKQAQATADTTQSAGQVDYGKARATCLEGKGYSVK